MFVIFQRGFEKMTPFLMLSSTLLQAVAAPGDTVAPGAVP